VAFKQFRNYSQTYITLKKQLIEYPKSFIVSKTNTGPRRKTRGGGIEVTQNYTNKPEMPPVTFVGSLCKIHAVLCSKIADVHDVRTFPIFIFRFSLHNTRDVAMGQEGTIPRSPNHCGGAKSPNNVTSSFFKTLHLLPKDLSFERGCGKLFFAPGAI